MFECHGKLDILNDVFNVRQASRDGKVGQVRPQYKSRIERLVALRFAELLGALEDKDVQAGNVAMVDGMKKSHCGPPDLAACSWGRVSGQRGEGQGPRDGGACGPAA